MGLPQQRGGFLFKVMTVNLEVFNRFFGPFVAVDQPKTQSILQKNAPYTLEKYHDELAKTNVFSVELLKELDEKIKAFNKTLDEISVVCVQEDILVLKDGTLTPLLTSIADIPLVSSCKSHVFGWKLTVDMYGAGGHLGNSIYSRVDGKNILCPDLSYKVNDIPRCYTMFEAIIGEHKIKIANVHLSGGRDDDKAALLNDKTLDVKSKQANQVIRSMPTIICGDFNTQPPVPWIKMRYGYFVTLLNYMFADPTYGHAAREGLESFINDKEPSNFKFADPTPDHSYYDQIMKHPKNNIIIDFYLQRYEKWMHGLYKVFTDNGYVYTNSAGKIKDTSAFGGCVDGIFALPVVRCVDVYRIDNSMVSNPKFGDATAGFQPPFTPYYTDHFPVVAEFTDA